MIQEQEHGEGGPPQSIYSYLWQAAPLGRFFQERWPTFAPVNAFLPQAYIIHSCRSFHIFHVWAVVKIHVEEKPVLLKQAGHAAFILWHEQYSKDFYMKTSWKNNVRLSDASV